MPRDLPDVTVHYHVFYIPDSIVARARFLRPGL